MPRLFIAIDVPDQHKSHLSALQSASLGVRWTSPAKYHLTLRFIGEVEETTRASVEQALEAVNVSPFAIEGQDLSVFPSLRNPRVLFAGVSSTQALIDLHKKISHTLFKTGIPPDAKPFRPHITLARITKATAPEIRSYIRSHESYKLPPFTVSQFHLYESILRPEGAEHQQLRTFSLSTTA